MKRELAKELVQFEKSQGLDKSEKAFMQLDTKLLQALVKLTEEVKEEKKP